MSKIRTLTTGAGVDTIIDLPNTPGFLQVGTIDTDLPLRKIAISVAGAPIQTISGVAVIRAVAKFLMQALVGADVKIPMLWKIANGWINKACKITLTNDGATTPDVYIYSTNRGDRAVIITQETIQELSNIAFSNFDGLFFDATNLDRAEIIFADGHNDTLTGAELAGLFAQDYNADADGLLGGLTVISNMDNSIAEVRLFADGGNITVTRVNL